MKSVVREQLLETAVLTASPQDSDVVRLLHVEDNAADALLMQEYIRDVLPSVVFDTAERLGDVTRERVAAVDCALLDLSLPDASGLEGLLALRKLSENLPIIVLTGFDDMELGLSAVREGADDYLLKNHVDGFTLERAVQYAIERRRLMLQLAQSAAGAILATAHSITVEAAAATALERVRGELTQPPEAPQTAPGTHEVAVRVDIETSEFVLQCRSCDWQSDRAPDGVHSWAERSLEMTLLSHIDFEHEGQTVAAAPATAEPVAAVSRRSVFRRQSWVG